MDSTLMDLVTPASYQDARRHLFPAQQSLDWYIRIHRAKLVECGAMLLIAKRRLLDPQLFDAYVLSAGRQAAAQRVTEAA